MKAYVITIENAPEERSQWDKHIGFVIVAESEEHARKLAFEAAHGSGELEKRCWMDSCISECKEIDLTKAHVVLESFIAG